MLGNFEAGRPNVEIEIEGIANQNAPVRHNACIDTGFNGYLTLPYAEVFPLGLVLSGAIKSTLADGSSSNSFLCIGKVIVGGREAFVTIDVQPEGNILVGTALLKQLGIKMKIDFPREKVELKYVTSSQV
jgi:clan AA aspartic protease